MNRTGLFDAVFFDLDGTLVATDRFWIEAADRGGRRAFAQLGLTRPLPTAAEWMSLVGTPFELGFRRLFPDLSGDARQVVMRACIAEEVAALEREGAPAMPAARETLEAVARSGARIGIASNCTLDYLDRMIDGLGVRPLVDAAYCAESPGITSKADMLERLLIDCEASAAVMVGDRGSDRDAAWDNGLPHIHCAFGFAQGDERVEAEGRIAALTELPAWLARRALWIEGLASALALFDRPALRVGISGRVAAGKTLLARDIARVLRARGRPAETLDLAAFATHRPVERDESDPLGRAFDLERLQREVLLPHEHGRAFDLGDGRRIEPGTTLLLDGPWLLGARRRLSLDHLVWLAASDESRLRRLQGRDRRRGPGPLPSAPDRIVPTDGLDRALLERFPPAANADRVVDATNPLDLGFAGVHGQAPGRRPPRPRGGTGLVRS